MPSLAAARSALAAAYDGVTAAVDEVDDDASWGATRCPDLLVTFVVEAAPHHLDLRMGRRSRDRRHWFVSPSTGCSATPPAPTGTMKRGPSRPQSHMLAGVRLPLLS